MWKFIRIIIFAFLIIVATLGLAAYIMQEAFQAPITFKEFFQMIQAPITFKEFFQMISHS